MSVRRSSGVMGPMRLAGGSTKARSTIVGRPFSSSSEINASPTPSSVIAAAVSTFAFARNVAAAATAFWSRGRVGAERVLEAVAELAQHDLRHVGRRLRDEIDADALRADQAHDLFDLVERALRRVGERAGAPRRRRRRASACRDRRLRGAAPRVRSSSQSRKRGVEPRRATSCSAASTFITPSR